MALAALMRVPKERRIELAGEALHRLVHCPENAYRKMLLCECVSAYLPIGAEQRQQFEDMVRNHPDSGVQAMELGLLGHPTLSPSQLLEIEAMLHRVQGWCGPVQLSLATRILQSLEASAAHRAAPLKNLLGLLATSAPAPSDEHCDSILAEERPRKLG